MSTRVQDEDFDLSSIIGRPYAEVAAMDLEWRTSYPLVDPDDMTVAGIVDGNYPDDPAPWTICDVVDGKVRYSDGACDCAVLLSDLDDETRARIRSDAGEEDDAPEPDFKHEAYS